MGQEWGDESVPEGVSEGSFGILPGLNGWPLNPVEVGDIRQLLLEKR